MAADLGHSPEFNHRFWKEFRRSVKLANPNAVIIAEHYGYSRDWLQGDEWDTVMNYDAFMEPITWFLTGMQKHSDDYREDLLGNAESFWGAMDHHQTNFTNSSLQVAMNELSNHDHSRFLTRTNRKVGRLHTLGSQAANEGVNKNVFREAVVMQMTWPGAPTIYYGDEAGLCGFTDPDNRRTYPWGKEDKELIEFHKQMIKIHKLNNVLLTGSLMNLGQDYNYVAYGRFDSEEQIVVCVNNNNHEIEKEIDVWRIGVPLRARLQRIAYTGQDGFSFTTTIINAENGKIKVKLSPESACVFKAVLSDSDRRRVSLVDEAKKAEEAAEAKARAAVDAEVAKIRAAEAAEAQKNKADKKSEDVGEKETDVKEYKISRSKDRKKAKAKEEPTKDTEAVKSDSKKSEEKKTEDKKVEDKKSEDKKTEDKKVDDKKVEEKKTEDKKSEDKKSEDKKSDEKKETTKKTTTAEDIERELNRVREMAANDSKTAWEKAEEKWGKPEDNKKGWFPFFK